MAIKLLESIIEVKDKSGEGLVESKAALEFYDGDVQKAIVLAPMIRRIMNEVNIEDLKEVMLKSGVNLLDCKKALKFADGDIHQAVAIAQIIGRDTTKGNSVYIPNDCVPELRASAMGQMITQNTELSNWFETVENNSNWNSGWFSELPYNERKYLMTVRGFEDYEKYTSDIQRFRISHIPADVKFQDCIPTLNELYIAHPYKPGVYLPTSRYEHLLFRERIHELSKIMMALGATEIRTIQSSDTKSYSKEDTSSRTSASGDYGSAFSGRGTYSSGSSHTANAESDAEIIINFKNDPLKLPSIPNGLVWFDHESEWQQIADSRLNGNILEYEIRLSSKQVKLVSNNERSNIEAQARILLASGNFSRETSSESIFKEESAKNTSILIKFKSRKDY